MDKKTAQDLLYKTINDFNKIAIDFSSKRAYNWDFLSYFLKYIKGGGKILDFGCGNARLFKFLENNLENFEYFGGDVSDRLLGLARENVPQKERQNLFLLHPSTKLPFKNHFFDIAFSIAVFHHIPSYLLRKEALTEIRRVLKKDGILIVTVWNLKSYFREEFLKNFFLKIFKRRKLDIYDVFIPWHNSRGEALCNRYVHCFSLKELAGVVKECGFKIVDLGYLPKDSKQNLYIVCRKTN